MSTLRRTAIGLPLTLLGVAGIATFLLLQESNVQRTERERTAYGNRLVWQAGFDALSVTCGVGLLTYDLHRQYTVPGRWVLALSGMCGAAAYLLAARAVAGRLWKAAGARLPAARTILLAYLAAQLAAVLAAVAVEATRQDGLRAADAAANAIAAFSSLGWRYAPAGAGSVWLYAAIGLAGALGWPVWLLLWRRPRDVRPLLLCVLAFGCCLALCAGLVTILEVPRAGARAVAGDDRLACLDSASRFQRAMLQVVGAAGAGVHTERLEDRGVGEGTKAVLAGVVLVGGLAGSPGGGVKLPFVLAFVVAAGALFRTGAGWSADPLVRRCLLAGTACVALLVAWAAVVALGLLIIESRVGSVYEPPPTCADALLDAGSAVGGAGLSSGLAATVTSANLSRGIRQPSDQYQYGMVWLMLAMIIGRMIPLLVLARAASVDLEAARPAGFVAWAGRGIRD